MRNSILFLLLLFSCKLFSQNVGVGTTTPVEKLDVNGNINVTGTIKANGTDGQPNQVLMKNEAGSFVWGDLCDFKNMAMYSGVPNATWTVPAGITRIFVEAWGAGGGGSAYGGGGGGAYTAANFTVTPGSVVTMILGEAGTAGSGSTNGGVGGQTAVNAGPYGISAGGGNGAAANISMSTATGGVGNASNTFTNYITIRGGAGKPVMNNFITQGSNTYETAMGGDGGSAAHAEATGGTGAYRMIIVNGLATLVRNKSAENGKSPGGGGGSGWSFVSSAGTSMGGQGSFGMVVIHY